MRTIKYIIILLVMISAASFMGCNEKKLDEHGHEAGTHAISNEKESPEQHKPGKSEEESEHEELPDDIVELNAEQIKLAGITPVSYTHLRAHETVLDLVCRLLLEKKKIESYVLRTPAISYTRCLSNCYMR